jgi:hypothetical protein
VRKSGRPLTSPAVKMEPDPSAQTRIAAAQNASEFKLMRSKRQKNQMIQNPRPHFSNSRRNPPGPPPSTIGRTSQLRPNGRLAAGRLAQEFTPATRPARRPLRRPMRPLRRPAAALFKLSPQPARPAAIDYRPHRSTPSEWTVGRTFQTRAATRAPAPTGPPPAAGTSPPTPGTAAPADCGDSVLSGHNLETEARKHAGNDAAARQEIAAPK